MTALEAIAVIEDRQTCRECVHDLNNKQEFECACDECDSAFGKAYDALKKQIPQKPKEINQDNITLRYCPSCFVRFMRYGAKYCGECGQALDWSDNNVK